MMFGRMTVRGLYEFKGGGENEVNGVMGGIGNVVLAGEVHVCCSTLESSNNTILLVRTNETLPWRVIALPKSDHCPLMMR